MKKWVIPIMLSGWFIFNCLFVGGYQIFEAGKEWIRGPNVVIDYMSLENADLLDMQKQIANELKFRANSK